MADRHLGFDDFVFEAVELCFGCDLVVGGEDDVAGGDFGSGEVLVDLVEGEREYALEAEDEENGWRRVSCLNRRGRRKED